METLTMQDLLVICKRRERRSIYRIMRNYADFPQPTRTARNQPLMFDKAAVLAWFEQHKDEVMEDLKHAAKGK
ncbi:hypothetical protein ABRR14_005089 [Escherichia coli]